MNLRCFYSENGSPRATGDDKNILVAYYLESDIQGDTLRCQELLKIAQDVQSNQIPQWEETGNAHTLTLTPTQAIIEAEFDESLAPLNIPLTQFKQALQKWLDFLQKEPPST